MLTRTQRSSLKARTKDSSFVLKDNQGPRTKAKDNIPGSSSSIPVLVVNSSNNKVASSKRAGTIFDWGWSKSFRGDSLNRTKRSGGALQASPAGRADP